MERCIDCEFYKAGSAPEDADGLCFRHPPTVSYVSGEGDPYPMSARPAVKEGDGCGEHVARRTG
jgi:hypothetical protein